MKQYGDETKKEMYTKHQVQGMKGDGKTNTREKSARSSWEVQRGGGAAREQMEGKADEHVLLTPQCPKLQ